MDGEKLQTTSSSKPVVPSWLQARRTLHTVCTALIGCWVSSHSLVQPMGAVSVTVSPLEGPAGGFLGQLLEQRAQAGGAGLTDTQVGVASYTFYKKWNDQRDGGRNRCPLGGSVFEGVSRNDSIHG